MRRGFTLAEVLITITIIGVIATLTVPSAMTNVKKKQHLTGYKIAYSKVQEIITSEMLTNLFNECSTVFPVENNSPGDPERTFCKTSEKKGQTIWKYINDGLQVQGYYADTTNTVTTPMSTIVTADKLKTKARWYSNPGSSTYTDVGKGSPDSTRAVKSNYWSPWIVTENGPAFTVEVHSIGGSGNASESGQECRSIMVINEQANIEQAVKKSCVQIIVDVNGLNKGPNTVARENSAIDTNTDLDEYIQNDRFRIYVGNDGITAGPKGKTETGRMMYENN